MDQDFITFQIRFSGIYELWVENVTVNASATFSILKQIGCIKNDNIPCNFWPLKGWISSQSILDSICTFVRLNICTLTLHSFYQLFRKTTNNVHEEYSLRIPWQKGLIYTNDCKVLTRRRGISCRN